MIQKWLVKTASTLFPKRVVAFAYGQLTSPQIRKLRDNELVVLDKSEKEMFKFQDFDIQLYTWKGGPKRKVNLQNLCFGALHMVVASHIY
ncbi:MAG: hypothetical protein AAF554_08990 [Bacteroidota bacterium]